MRKEKKAALKMLRKAARVFNCWEMMDEAITCGELDGYPQEYIDGERRMLASDIVDLQKAIEKLGKLYGIDITTSDVEVREWEDRR